MTLTLDVIDILEQSAFEGRDIYADLVSAGQQDAADMDERRWRLGDLACLVTKEYGKNRIAEWAKDVNAVVASVRSYRAVASFFDRQNVTRVEFSHSPVVTWSHFRLAARFKKHDHALDKADDFIRWIADNAVTVEKAGVKLSEAIGKPTPPVKLFDGELCADAAGEWIVFRLRNDGLIAPQTNYTLKIYEVSE